MLEAYQNSATLCNTRNCDSGNSEDQGEDQGEERERMGAGRIGARQVRFWMFRLRYTLPTFTIPDLSRSALSRSACPLCLPRSACRSAPVPLCPPIVRTAGADRSKRELSRDLAYLLRLWKVIVRRIKKMPAPWTSTRRAT